EELRRVLPVVAGIAGKTGVPVSVDTTKARVARESLKAGASMVNDTSALRDDPKMKEVVAASEAPVVLMHRLGKPRTMQENPSYASVVGEIMAFLSERIEAAVAAGIEESRIIVDPGIGFGKTLEHNLALLRHLSEFRSLGLPVLLGTSRKSFIGKVLGESRLPIGATRPSR